MAKRNKNDFYLYEKDKNIDELDTHNIGMKKPDPSSHSNIAQIYETDEVELRKKQYEKLEKRRRLGLSERKKQEDDELLLLDTEIISKELIEQNSRNNAIIRIRFFLNFIS